MPPSALEHRVEQVGALAEVNQRLLRDKQLYRRVSRLMGLVRERRIRGTEARNIMLAHEVILDSRKMPLHFEGEMARLTGFGGRAWSIGRETGDFSEFIPILKRMVEKQRSFARRNAYDRKDLYTPLLQVYLPEFTAKELERIFADIKRELLPLFAALRSLPPIDAGFITRDYDEKKLDSFSRRILRDIGFDFSHGRLDVSVHPSCHGTATDTRLFTRYRTIGSDIAGLDAVWSALHEGGHGLYQQGISSEYRGTPIDGAISTSIDESQSRFWEVFLGKSRPFLQYYFPKLKRLFPKEFRGVGFEGFYRGMNGIRDPLIRIKTDMLTYCFHIMLRFEIERALVSGDIDVEEIPDTWDRLMEGYIGLKPKDANEGWAQDMHWAHGMFGYFPSYLVGNMVAAQLYYALRRSRRNLDEELRQGNFTLTLQWMRNRIHKHGARYGEKALIYRATGRPLEVAPLIRFIRERYGDVYGVKL